MSFKSFSRIELQELLLRFPLPEKGVTFLETAILEPSRKVQGTIQSEVSYIQCRKMNATLESESGVEARAILNYIFDEQVLGYLSQPPKLPLDYIGRNGRRVRTGTHADFLVMHREMGFLLHEWKSASSRSELETDFPGRFSNGADGHVYSQPAEASAKELGMKYEVQFSDQISETRILNYLFLLSYVNIKDTEAYLEKLELIRTMLERLPAIRYCDLVKDLNGDSDSVNWAIANAQLQIDWDVDEMSQPHLLTVYRDLAALNAFRFARRAPQQRSASRYEQNKFRVGQVFVFDGVRFTVELVGLTALHAKSERGDYIEKSWQFVEAQYLEGKLILELDESSQFASSPSRLLLASSSQIRDAINRLRILTKIDSNDELEPTERFSERSIRRWRRGVSEALAAGMQAIDGVIDKKSSRGFRGTHIDDKLSQFIDQEIVRQLMQMPARTILAIYKDIDLSVVTQNRQMISKPAFYKRVKKLRTIETIRASRGHKVAYQIQPLYWQLEVATPIHSQRAFELVHIDHTLLEMEVISSLTGEVLGRVWITLAFCAYSRRVLGFYLSLHPPSFVSVMMVLSDIFGRFGRRPEWILHDWGAEFGSQDLETLCGSLDINKRYRPKSCARFGNCIERFFGITQSELLSSVRGSTRATRNVRTLTSQVQPSKHSGLTLADLHVGLDEFFFKIFDQRRHPTLLRSPKQFYEDSRISDGVRPHQLITVNECLPIILPTVKGTTRLSSSARGVFVNYEYYGNSRLMDPALDGLKVVTRLVPFHPGIVYVEVNGEWLQCKSKKFDELEKVPEYVRRAVFEEFLYAKRAVAWGGNVSGRQVAQLTRALNEIACSNRDYWASKDKQTIHFVDILGSNVSAPPAGFKPTATQMSALEEQFSNAIEVIRRKDTYGQLVK
jgi:putative transposase